ncbi:cytochrome P450 [Ganoderma sinense ZZ0214-1]|uniref:Cytochrome P450 n=1 Tax=Ganoderma sinense ZZ0214-1 TaxID=1077348 RepID=A0A2G8S672_9APHY|nr:cytochrome P450 [Ganoderma sinense ZZ0214-1]
MVTPYSFGSMFQDATPVLIVVSSIFFVVFIAQYIRYIKTVDLPLPPGPRPLPIIGNVFDIPKKLLPCDYREISNRYGDIVHLHALGQHIILLGSLEVAIELLERRSVKYSGKPYSAMSELYDATPRMTAVMNSGPTWRKHRRELHKFFSPSAYTQWNAMQEGGIRQLLSLLLEDPEHFAEHAELYVHSLPCLAYGILPKDHHDEALKLAMKGANILSDAFVPGKYLVESFPQAILRHIPSWFPGARFQREIATWRRTLSLVRNKAFDDSIAKMDIHSLVPYFGQRGGSFERSMVTAMVQEAEGKGTFSHETDSIARDVSFDVYLDFHYHRGGVDITLITTRVFLLAMALNPQAQKRAQAQLDAVIGATRLPSLSNRDSLGLPYIEALVMECHRWHPILPFTLPRMYTGEEDEYKGYRILKGSLVIANTWAFAHDPRNYPDPEKFMPERYLTKEGKLNPDIRDPRTFTFGYRRRACPGRHFGDASVWLAVASILHVFDIRPPLDDNGEPVALTAKFTEGLLSAPEPFQCRITPGLPPRKL